GVHECSLSGVTASFVERCRVCSYLSIFFTSCLRLFLLDVLFFLIIRRPPISTLFPYTTLFRSCRFATWSRSRSSSGACSGRRSRSEEHTSELQSRFDLVCRLLLEKKKKTVMTIHNSYAIFYLQQITPNILHYFYLPTQHYILLY